MPEVWTVGIPFPGLVQTMAHTSRPGLRRVRGRRLPEPRRRLLRRAGARGSRRAHRARHRDNEPGHTTPRGTAAAAASLQLASGGRFVLGIGRGDSALAHLGRGRRRSWRSSATWSHSRRTCGARASRSASWTSTRPSRRPSTPRPGVGADGAACTGWPRRRPRCPSRSRRRGPRHRRRGPPRRPRDARRGRRSRRVRWGIDNRARRPRRRRPRSRCSLDRRVRQLRRPSRPRCRPHPRERRAVDVRPVLGHARDAQRPSTSPSVRCSAPCAARTT